MIIYFKSDGNVSSFPSSIPFGSSLREVTVIAPDIVATISLRIKPPNGEYLQPIIFQPRFSGDGSIVFVGDLERSITNLAGRAYYQVEATTADGEVITSEQSSFNITRGVLVDIPKSPEELSQYNVETLYEMLSNVTLLYNNIGSIETLIGVGKELETTSKTLVEAINEIYKRGGVAVQLPIAEEVSV